MYAKETDAITRDLEKIIIMMPPVHRTSGVGNTLKLNNPAAASIVYCLFGMNQLGADHFVFARKRY